jgi:MFS family permease
MTLVGGFNVLLVGRLLYGIACGGFSVFCPKYISEASPVELKGPAGCLTQICITFGIIVPFSIGLAYEEEKDKNDE